MRTPIALVILLFAAPVRAQDPFAAIESGDPIDLARVVDRLGDGAVLERLAEDRPRAVQLAAIRATPYLAYPELALERLVAIASGRDPDLAPAAASAALAIAEHLTLDELSRREVDPASLTPARRALRRLGDDRSARADLRTAAARAAAHLDALGVPR